MRSIRLAIVVLALVAVLGLVSALLRPALAQLGSASPVATAVTVGTSSVQLVPANGARHGLTIYNQSSNVISVLPGAGTAVANAAGTINIAASGGMLTITCNDRFPCGNAFQAIASGASSAVTVWEY